MVSSVDLEHEPLDCAFRAVLARLTLISDGRCTVYDGDVRRSPFESRSPVASERDERGRPAYVVDSLARDYGRCSTHRARREVVAQAIKELIRAKYAPDVARRRGTKEWRRAIAEDSRPVAVIAEVFAVSRQSVYNYRTEFRHLRVP